MRHLILLLLLIPTVIFAQDAEALSINLDESSTVLVSAESSTQIAFILDESNYIRLDATSSDEAFDPVLWIIDTDKRLVAYNDNMGETSEAIIDNLYLLAGTYTIFVDSFNGVSDGDVQITLNSIDPNEIELIETEQSIVIDGILLEDTVYVYFWDASAGDTITIIAEDTSGNLDPYLRLLDSNQQELIANDDHMSNNFNLSTFDAQIDAYEVIETGQLMIEIRDFLGRAGEFRITITID